MLSKGEFSEGKGANDLLFGGGGGVGGFFLFGLGVVQDGGGPGLASLPAEMKRGDAVEVWGRGGLIHALALSGRGTSNLVREGGEVDTRKIFIGGRQRTSEPALAISSRRSNNYFVDRRGPNSQWRRTQGAPGGCHSPLKETLR